ncbi:MAG: MSCRAMM family adhesin SdrC, partial [Pseudomonadales bacterium]|nr:MSCRAMM family adhesin SdrC [Pseudomonadales bacterium]
MCQSAFIAITGSNSDIFSQTMGNIQHGQHLQCNSPAALLTEVALMDAPAIAQLKILDNKTSSPSKAIESALPVGKAVTAKITQVTPEQARQDSHRVKLEINKSVLQISAKFSGSVPEKGSTVSLQRSASGQIQLSIIASGDSAAKQPSGNQASSSTTVANSNATNNRATTETTPTQSNANNAVKTTGSEQPSSANSAALTAKLAANNLSPLLANNTKPTTGQTNPNSVTLKVPVTINASGAALNIIQQALPKGETLSARVINQVLTNTSANNPTPASPNAQPTTTLANNSGQIPAVSQQQASGITKT